MKGFTGGGPTLREGRENKWMSRAKTGSGGTHLKRRKRKTNGLVVLKHKPGTNLKRRKRENKWISKAQNTQGDPTLMKEKRKRMD